MSSPAKSTSSSPKKSGWKSVPIRKVSHAIKLPSGGSQRNIPIKHNLKEVAEDSSVQDPFDATFGVIDATSDLTSSQPGEEPNEAKRSARDPLLDLKSIEDIIINSIISTEWDPLTSEPCRICTKPLPLNGLRPALYRCEDCSIPHVMCSACIIEQHRTCPFHWIQFWNGSFFERKTLKDLGLVIQLHHESLSCPHASVADCRELTLVHVNGIQTITVQYCICPGQIDDYAVIRQLSEYRLVPATTKSPNTVFTHHVLRDFHTETNCSSISAYDYMEKLRRLTSRMFVHAVPERYREFLRVCRIWRHLQARKRTGEALGITGYLPVPIQNQLAVRCPACPQPGLNMDEHPAALPVGKRHINTLFLHMDGNFHLDRKRANGEGIYHGLWDGQAYFPLQKDFLKYLSIVIDEPSPRTCHAFKVLDDLRRIREGLDVSGIMSVVCRHGLFRPSGTVDLQKGERFLNADYALSGALIGSESLQRICVSYDVVCQYLVNVRKRFQQYFKNQVPQLDKILYLVPKAHLVGHKELCELMYSFNYTSEVGRTHGEVVEQGWSKGNENVGSTREMKSGHRHDTLNDQHSSLNLDKVVGLSRFLARKLDEAIYESSRCRRELDELNEVYGNKRITEWSQLDTTTKITARGIESVYKMSPQKLPSKAQIMQELTISDANFNADGDPESHAPLDFINRSLFLERLRTRVSRETDDEKQSALRQRFIKQYTVWDQLRRTHLPVMPEDCSYHDNGDDQNQLPHIIYPSSYSNSERSRLHLQNLVDLELQLRSGQLVDIIGDLRLVIRRKALLLHYRKTKSVNSGKAVWTRSQVRINNITHEVETLCQIYNDSQRRFQSLRATSSNVSDRGVEFPPMKPEDLMLAGVVHYLHVGRGYDKISWIWKVLKSAASAEDDDNWNTEADKVNWFEVRARRDRWHEEVEILEAELRRCYRFFGTYSQAWKAIANDATRNSEAWTAYCLKISTMFSRMQDNVSLPSKESNFLL